LADVLDLYSCSVIGWSMSDRINTDLALGALTMACWRRRDHTGVVVNFDQGCQYTSYEWRSMLKTIGLKVSMSRGGNCHDNACAESFFSLLKKEQIRRRTYPTRETAKADVVNYIETFAQRYQRHAAIS
jgi:putative transposase